MALPTTSPVSDSSRSSGLRVMRMPDGQLQAPTPMVLHAKFGVFMKSLTDDRGRRLQYKEHHAEWCELFQETPHLVLLAPRDHGKTWTSAAYLLWRAWRHNRDPETGLLYVDRHEGKWEAVMFSLKLEQAEGFFEVVQMLAVANDWLFHDLLPDFQVYRRAALREVWSRRRMRLKNGAEIAIRSFKTTTRGLHPDLLLLDDVLDDKTTNTPYQRDAAWRYFVGTLVPMHASQIIVIGTALHYDDLLHRLRPKPRTEEQIAAQTRVPFRFKWVRYQAVDLDAGTCLWPERHGYDELMALRDFDPILFSREYQNDPRDDASSMFPRTLTDLLKVPEANFLTLYRKTEAEAVILGEDLARSEAAGADYTVQIIASYNQATQKRRVLYARRAKGLTFQDQLGWLRDACQRYQVDMAVVEENGFQHWLFQESKRYPETAGKVVGHRTGQEKADLDEGVPALKLAFQNGLWEFPTGDAESEEFFKVWQGELAAFGWKDGKLQGVGSHDDTVMATWFVERGVRMLQQWLGHSKDNEILYGEDLGFEPVKAGTWDEGL